MCGEFEFLFAATSRWGDWVLHRTDNLNVYHVSREHDKAIAGQLAISECIESLCAKVDDTFYSVRNALEYLDKPPHKRLVTPWAHTLTDGPRGGWWECSNSAQGRMWGHIQAINAHGMQAAEFKPVLPQYAPRGLLPQAIANPLARENSKKGNGSGGTGLV